MFDFGTALKLLKDGKAVARKGWNGKGMFLTLQSGSEVAGTDMRNEPAKIHYGNSKVSICPHIDMKAADGTYVVGWLASQTDMLAEDWEIVNPIEHPVSNLSTQDQMEYDALLKRLKEIVDYQWKTGSYDGPIQKEVEDIDRRIREYQELNKN